MIVLANLDEFGREWSLPEDDLRLWVCVHEVAHHAVLSLPHVRARLESLLHEYVAGFEPDSGTLESKLGELDVSDLSALDNMQQLLGDPEVLLGAIQSPAQRELLPRLEALVAVVVGYVDHLMDEIGQGLIGSYDMVTEAMRRRRVTADPSDRFVERLLGLELHAGAVRARLGVHRRRRRPRRAAKRSTACGSPIASCRHRPKSTPPASGSRESTSPTRPRFRCRRVLGGWAAVQ